MSEDRNADGTFKKGHTVKRFDLTKEMASNMVSKELWHLADMLANKPHSYLEQLYKERKGDLSTIAVMMIEKIKNKKDIKALMWFIEMTVGKPKQQLEHSTPKDRSFKLSYERSK